MELRDDASPTVVARTVGFSPTIHNGGGAAIQVEGLSFTVRIAQSDDELTKAVKIRHSAYARHVPNVAEKLKVIEPSDHEDGCIVLLAESKLDGSPIGTMRIHTNRYRRLPLESSVILPGWLQGKRLAEATRLGVEPNRTGRLVKTLLFKALYQYCVAQEIDWMVIAARAPLDRMYEALLFQDTYPGSPFLPMAHAGNIPHRVLSFDVVSARARWSAASHPLLGFMCNTKHPDLHLDPFEHSAQPPLLTNQGEVVRLKA